MPKPKEEPNDIIGALWLQLNNALILINSIRTGDKENMTKGLHNILEAIGFQPDHEEYASKTFLFDIVPSCNVAYAEQVESIHLAAKRMMEEDTQYNIPAGDSIELRLESLLFYTCYVIKSVLMDKNKNLQRSFAQLLIHKGFVPNEMNSNYTPVFEKASDVILESDIGDNIKDEITDFIFQNILPDEKVRTEFMHLFLLLGFHSQKNQ